MRHRNMMMETLYQLAAEPPEYKNLTNDVDRVMCALRWVNDNGIMDKVLLFDVHKKSPAKATHYIERGNHAFCRSSVMESWWIYNKATLYALPNSEELARAYANRSAATFNLCFYPLSLRDIDRALAIGYPDHLKAKLYIRQVKCLWGVHQEMCPEIEAAIAKAEEWIEKANECNRSMLRNALNSINIPDVISRGMHIPGPKTPVSAHFISATPADNPKIVGASKSIELKYSEDFGRHLAAAQDINAGQVLFFDQSFASISAFKSPKREFILNCCWNCFDVCRSSVPCIQCVHVIYCSEECRDEDWNNCHAIDCPIISQLAPSSDKPELFLALRMAIKAFNEAGSFQELKNKICRIDATADPIEKLLEENVFDSSKYASVYSLASDDQPSFDQSVQAVIVLIILCRLTKIFNNEMTEIRDIINHEWTAFMGSLILRNFRIIDVVGYIQMLTRPTDDTSVSCCAHAVQPLTALCNHSCDANAGMFFHRNIFIIIALQKITSGEQIVLSYGTIGFQEQSKIVRKKQLQETFRFSCTCTACTNDWKISRMTSYKYLLSGEKLEQFDTWMHRLIGLQMTSKKESRSEQITLLKMLLNTFDATTQSSCVEFFHFKSMLHDLYKKESF